MEIFDYSQYDEEDYDKVFEEADNCEDCYSKEHLALAVLTDSDHCGTLILFCAKCHIEKEDTDFTVEDKTKTKYV